MANAWPTIERADIARRVRVEKQNGTRVFLLRGPAGIGKTTAANSVASQLATGREVARMNGSPSGLWMVGGDLPRPVSFDPSPPKGSISVADIATDSIFVVDDAHELEAETTNWLYLTLAFSDREAILTTRDDAALTGGLERLLIMDASAVLDVPPLTDGETAQLLAAALTQPVSGKTSRSVRKLSDGNPFVLRELVRTNSPDLLAGNVDALLRGKDASPAITTLLRSQLDGLSDDAREAMELLSIPDDLPLDVAFEALGQGVVGELERAGLVAISTDDEPTIRIRHRWCRASLHNSLSAPVRRTMAARLSMAFDSTIAEHPDRSAIAVFYAVQARAAVAVEDLRRATWTAVDAEQWPIAAALARHGAALGDDWSTVGLAQVLIAMRTRESLHEVRSLLRGLSPTDVSDDLAELLPPLLALTESLLGDRETASTLLEGKTARPGEPDDEVLAVAQAIHDLLFESPRQAALRLQPWPSKPAAQLRVLAAAMAGDLGLAIGSADRPEHAPIDALATLYGDDHRGTAPSGSFLLSSADAAGLSARIGFAVQAAGAAQALGHLRSAADWFTTIISSEYWSVESLFAYAGVCECAHYLGRDDWLVEASHQLAVRFEELGSPLAGLGMHQRTEALCLSTQPGNVQRVRQIILDAGARLHEHDYLLMEADLYQMAAKLGVTDGDIASRHESLAAQLGTDIVKKQAAAGRSYADADWPQLLATCKTLAAGGGVLGSILLAAHGAGSAAKAGDPKLARQLALHAEQLRAGTDISPNITGGGANIVGSLSIREREVARLAADGLSSKEIAQRIDLSRKTVDNTLQRAYRKLGVSSRSDLRDLVSGDAGALDA